MKKPITVEIKTEFLDEAIEKANRLVELLKEAVQIIDSLTGGQKVQRYSYNKLDFCKSDANDLIIENN